MADQQHLLRNLTEVSRLLQESHALARAAGDTVLSQRLHQLGAGTASAVAYTISPTGFGPGVVREVGRG